MDNKERNQTILDTTCELLGWLNVDLNDAFVEDIHNEENEDEEQVLVSLAVANPALLIGFRGKHLAALQLLIGLAAKKKLGYWVRVLVDVNNYREEQKTRLESMATALAARVKDENRPIAMAHMSSYERRLCHLTLQKIEGIVSDSEGEGDDRHIVIKPLV